MSAPAGQVLVVDGDAATRKFLEQALASAGWTVESANDGTSALDILQTSRVDAILCESTLADMTGLQLHRRLLQVSRLRGVPFILLSSDDSVEALAAALRSGADDYLVKPVDAKSLAVRVESHVSRQQRQRDAMRSRRYLLAGDFSALNVPDLLTTLSLQRRTGTISVVTDRAMGEVHIDSGQVVHATYGSLGGLDAFCALFSEDSAQFEFTPQETALPAESRTITNSVLELVMEAARRFDESHKEGGAAMPLPKPRVATPTGSVLPPLKPGEAMAKTFVEGIQDGFALGELFLWVGPELDRWIRRTAQTVRLHVHLIADLSAGVASMLALSTPPSERLLLGSFRSGPKSAGLVYFLKNDHLLDVVLVDMESVAARVHSLLRRPSITIIAPRNGDFLEIGPREKIGIDTLLALRAPSLLVGIGNPSMEQALVKLTPAGSRSLLVPGTLGDGHTDLRDVLVKSIEAWGAEQT